MTRFGIDASTFILNDEGAMDLDPFFVEISGPRVIAEAVARRWTSEKGSLFWDPDCGEDVRALLGSRFDPSEAVDLQSTLSAEAEKDERVLRCSVLVTWEQAAKRVRIRAAITPAEGPSFQFVMLHRDVAAQPCRPMCTSEKGSYVNSPAAIPRGRFHSLPPSDRHRSDAPYSRAALRIQTVPDVRGMRERRVLSTRRY